MNGVTALVASPGGHIEQLMEVAGRWSIQRRFWITAATPQTTSMLATEDVEWVRPVGSRQGWRAATSLGSAVRIMRARRPIRVVSTGAALTVPYLLTARAVGIPVTYVESATRFAGPSITGRIMERTPGVSLYRQGPWRNKPRWTDFGSIFDSFEVCSGPTREINRVLVTLGSERFPFRRAIDMACLGLPASAQVQWQTGHTPIDVELPGESREWWPAMELVDVVRDADLVVTHAGVGSILMTLRQGLCPVVIPRRPEDGEHIDDHQLQLVSALQERGIVAVATSSTDFADAVAYSVQNTIVRRPSAPGAAEGGPSDL